MSKNARTSDGRFLIYSSMLSGGLTVCLCFILYTSGWPERLTNEHPIPISWPHETLIFIAAMTAAKTLMAIRGSRTAIIAVEGGLFSTLILAASDLDISMAENGAMLFLTFLFLEWIVNRAIRKRQAKLAASASASLTELAATPTLSSAPVLPSE